MERTIGIIGFGNMGKAIAWQLKADYRVYAFDKENAKTAKAKGIEPVYGIPELVSKAANVILAVKPQDIEEVLNKVKLIIKDNVIISIVAGITTGYIEKILCVVRVVRAMPNITVKIGEGVTCLSGGKFASDGDLDFAENLFDYMGETIRIKEEMMNAATAVSGSGPAYVCHYLEKGLLDFGNIHSEKNRIFLNDFKEAALALGFKEDEASFLVNNTFYGTAGFLKKTGISTLELKGQVASKGGTTEAALAILNKGGALKEAVQAAFKRAEELSRR